MLLPYDTGNMLHHIPSFTTTSHPASCSTEVPVAHPQPLRPWHQPLRSFQRYRRSPSRWWIPCFGILFGAQVGLDLARIWQDAVALFFRIPDIIFTLLALAWLDITGCWKVLFGQCQAAPTRSQWRASEELEVSQLCRRQRLSMAE